MKEDEISHHLLVEGALWIKDALSHDPTTYFDFISALVALWKRVT